MHMKKELHAFYYSEKQKALQLKNNPFICFFKGREYTEAINVSDISKLSKFDDFICVGTGYMKDIQTTRNIFYLT